MIDTAAHFAEIDAIVETIQAVRGARYALAVRVIVGTASLGNVALTLADTPEHRESVTTIHAQLLACATVTFAILLDVPPNDLMRDIEPLLNRIDAHAGL
jgi:hypothetical protein